MATEITAQLEQPVPGAHDDGDYDAFCAALSASARGRAFLTEYARRNRNADTEQLLAAIAQLQQTVLANSAPKVTEKIKAELRALLDEIAATESELEASITATKATTLAALVALIARRIAGIMALTHAENLPPAEINQPGLAQESKRESKNEQKETAERAHLAIVPIPEQPELPIPSPLVTPLPSIALVRSETVMAEVTFVEPPPASEVKPTAVQIDVPAIEPATQLPAPVAAIPRPSTPAAALASIMALSEEERLALFT